MLDSRVTIQRGELTETALQAGKLRQRIAIRTTTLPLSAHKNSGDQCVRLFSIGVAALPMS